MRIIGFFLALLITCSVQSQNAFHRAYPTFSDTSAVNISATQFLSGEYMSLDGLLAPTDSLFKSLLITQYGQKGDINWSKKITTNELGFTLDEGSIYTSGDSITATATIYKKDGPNKFKITVDKRGQYLHSNILGNELNSPNSMFGTNVVVASPDTGFVQYTNFGDEESPSTLLRRIRKDGSTAFAKKYTPFIQGQDGLNGATDVNIGIDSSILITGINNELISIHLTVLDTLGRIKFGKVYSDTETFIPVYVGLSVVQGKDSSYVLAGQFIDINPLNIFQSFFGSFILKVDRNGDILWAKKISSDSTIVNIISNAVVNDDNSIVAAGVIVSNLGESRYFLTKFDSKGGFQWTKQYNRSEAQYNSLGHLFKTQKPGYAYFNTAIVDQKGAVGFIRADELGNTTCQDSVNNFFVDANMVSDTLIWKSEDAETVIELDYPVTFETFDGFNVPTVNLQDHLFCPNVPIDWTFDATAEGAVGYLWSDGSKLPTLRIFDLEQYTVMVTIDDKYCFTLCDTSQVKQKQPTTVTATPFCNAGKVNLGANVTTESLPISLKWSTGDSTEFITVSQSGIYSVTVIDGCNDTTFASTNVTIPASTLVVSVAMDVDRFCLEKIIVLQALTTATGLGGEPYTYIWNTAATTDSIFVSAAGEYTVTVTDQCGSTDVGSIDFTLPDPKPPTINITPTGYNFFCTNGFSLLNVSIFAGLPPYTFKWSDGSEGNVLKVLDEKVYTVTVTDACQATAVASYDYKFPQKPVLNVSISQNFDRCDEGIILVPSIFNGVGPFTFKWSLNNSTDSTILVTPPASFSVTVTDKCGATGTATIDVAALKDPTVSISPDFGKFCLESISQLQATGDGIGQISYAWSNGATSSVIVVSETNTYTVTITDACKNTATASYNFSLEDDKAAAALAPKLQFAEFFWPQPSDNTVLPENQVFGPLNPNDVVDLDQINNYEFHVFNRFGKEVFATTDYTESWDGTDGTPPQPTDSQAGKYEFDGYVWYCIYTYGICEISVKGNVVLFR